jgi:hypothetical protein
LTVRGQGGVRFPSGPVPPCVVVAVCTAWSAAEPSFDLAAGGGAAAVTAGHPATLQSGQVHRPSMNRGEWVVSAQGWASPGTDDLYGVAYTFCVSCVF